MAQWKEITTQDEWRQTLERSMERPLLVMKHSTRCPVSADAWQECRDYTAGSPREEADYVLVKVVESRDVSDRIARDLGLKHESPQAILVKDGEPVWNTSHWHIKKESLEKAINGD